MLTLYYHPLSSFCHKVLVALYENATVFERRIVNLGDSKDRSELLALWPIGKFPVIRDQARNRVVAETSIIIEYLDHLYAGERPLIPRDWEEALQVRMWDRFFDNYVQVPMQQIVGDHLAGAGGDMTRERSVLETSYGVLDAHMTSRAWAVGEAFSMADCAAAPALFYASTLRPLPPQLKNLRGYFERLMDRDSVHRVLEEAKPYFQFYPFADAIPARFR